MTCREIADFLMDYFDAELPHAVRAEFERHLEHCPPCVNYLKSYATTMQLTRRAYCEDAADCPDVPEELVKAILAARKKGGPHT